MNDRSKKMLSKKEIPSKDEFITNYYALSKTKLANHYRVSLSLIYRWSTHYGLSKEKKKPTKKELQEYLNLHTNKDACSYFKLSISSIDRLIKKYELTDMQKALIVESWRKLPLPSKEDFDQHYKNKPLYKVANHYGVSENTVVRWRQQLDVELKGSRGQHTKEVLPELFTDRQYQIVIGSLLGDGCLRKTYGPFENSYFTEQHGPDQYGYLQYKFKELDQFSNSLKPKSNFKVIHPAKNGNPYKIDYNQNRTSFIYDTYSSPLFTALEKAWYKRKADGQYEYIQRAIRLI